MKVLKRIFLVLAGIILAICAFILICALNPSLSQKVSTFLYGNDERPGVTQILTPQGFKDYFKIPLIFRKDDNKDSIVEDNGTTLGGFISDAIIAELPDGVGMLTGYQPVEVQTEQISDDKANELRGDLGTGDTGSALSFDTLIYPYYAMLDAAEADVYKQIYANACACRSAFTPVKNINVDGVKRAFEAVVNDHPELFFLETAYTAKYEKNGNVVEIDLSYYTIVNELETAKDKFNSAANSIIAGARELEDNYSREKYVHDALVAAVMYDDTAKMNQSAYSALVLGKTVCAGYARANQYILQQLGIPCYYCVGYSGQDHAWNIVKLEDDYYNEDITWDDTMPSTYDYFNRNDNDFSTTHTRTGLSLGLPKCNGFKYRARESGSVADVTIPEGTTVGGNEVHPEPLRYDDVYGNGSTVSPEDAEHAALVEALASIGLAESDVTWNMDEYNSNCYTELVKAGSGDQHFSIVIPESLFE